MKIPVSPNGEVGQIHTATRLVLPGVGCMWCNGLIDPTELAIEMHPPRPSVSKPGTSLAYPHPA